MPKQFNGTAAEILLVEDNPADARLTVETLRDSKVSNNLHHVSDGVQAMAFLRRQNGYSDVPRPDLILLDLNMPKMDGREVLAELKMDPEFSDIPVVVLTTSEAEQDVLNSYKLHANCFVTKPVDFEQFQNVIRDIGQFWFMVVKLPEG